MVLLKQRKFVKLKAMEFRQFIIQIGSQQPYERYK